jgi:Tfp pilus assembly protein PilW
MRRSSCKRLRLPPRPETAGGQSGLTMLEVVAALSISVLALASVHLTAGTAVLGKLLASSTVAKEQQGRQAVAWIADRVRQAGFRAAGSSIPRCQDKIATQPGYLPTASELWVNGDVDNSGTPQTRGFRVETVSGVPTLTETVIDCVTGATAVDEPITSPTSVQVLGLGFAYYDANGNPVTNLTSPASIGTIRGVAVTLQLRASAGARGPATATWTSTIDLRNP